jgi:hypothetical protein
MDPVSILSLVANVLQVAQLTLDVITKLSWFYCYVRHAPAQSKELQLEVNTLFHVLKDVEAAFDSVPVPQVVQEELNKLAEFLNDLKQRANPERFGGARRVRWPFSQKENGELLKKIDRYKSTLNISLSSQLQSGLQFLLV